MNRRSFITRIAAAIVGAAVAPLLPSSPTPIFTELVPVGPVGDFDVIYYWQGELLCDSPRQWIQITEITE